jgi:Protein of unknown function (DUF3347)
MKNIITLVAVVLVYTGAFSQNTKSILNQYLQVKDALVKSDMELATKHADLLHKSIHATDFFPEKENLLKEVQKMKDANNIGNFRDSFADVSSLMWKEIKDNDAIKDIIYYQYCPMKKMYWISREKAIKNPYYGSKMLSCGNVSEKNK